MTGIRYSVAIAEESTFGEGAGSNKFYTLSAGAYMSATANISTETVFSPGSKFFDTAIYGRLSGSFEIDFVLSYEYLGLFKLVFEDYKPETIMGEDGITPTGLYRHTFKKANNKRVGSFVIRRKTLNKITGPTSGLDEATEFRGCVIKSLRISQSSGSSKLSVTVSGYFKEPITDLKALSETDFEEFEGQPVEWACALFDDKYVKTVESLTLSVDNGANMMYTTCRDTSINYYEDKSSFQFGMTTYSNDFTRVKGRALSGGQAASHAASGNTYKNMCKNKKPLKSVKMLSFNTCAEGSDGVLTAYNNATQSVMFNIEDCIVKSATWQKGDGSRMLDQISSAECKKISMVVVNNIASYATPPTDHQIS